MQGVIDRRILVNFRIEAEAMAAVLPEPFRPQLVAGQAIGGICLIRLTHVKPKAYPWMCGIRSENAAHRVAVEWDADGEVKSGVYIPRRDTDSHLNAIVGGRLFPGVHHRARFEVDETEERFGVSLQSDDGETHVGVHGRVAHRLPSASVFAELEHASAFFEAGSLGYSDTAQAGVYDGLELRTDAWSVEALDVEKVASSYFLDEDRFPPGSVVFDHALLMRGIPHEWHGKPPLCD